MGLDMHLYRLNPIYGDVERAIACYENLPCWFIQKDEKVKDALLLIKPFEEIASWHKANAIHGWFMNCGAEWVPSGDENHNGGFMHVPREKLEALVGCCERVLGDGISLDGEKFFLSAEQWEDFKEQRIANRMHLRDCMEDVTVVNENLALELLPPVRGCFFGTYELDGWYIDDLYQTISQLNKVIGDWYDGQEYYHPWW